MKKILFITASDLSENNGPTIHFLELIRFIKEYNEEIEILAPLYSKVSVEFDVKKTFIKVPRIRTFSRIIYQFKMFFWIHKNRKRFDVIYTRLCLSMIIPCIISKMLNIDHYLEVNGNLFYDRKHRHISFLLIPYIWILHNLNFTFSKNIFFLTKGLREYFINKINFDEKKAEVVGVGVDVDFFSKGSDEKYLMQIYPAKIYEKIKRSKKVIGFTGTLDVWQNLEVLFEACEHVSEKISDFFVVIAGDGKNAENYKKIVIDKKLDSKVFFIGKKKHVEIAYLMPSFTLCVLPREKINEGFAPIKLYEYLAASKPIIASNVSGFEFIKEVGCGSLFKAGDAKAMAKEIINMFVMSDSMLKEIGEKGREFVKNNLTWHHIAKKTIEVIEK